MKVILRDDFNVSWEQILSCLNAVIHIILFFFSQKTRASWYVSFTIFFSVQISAKMSLTVSTVSLVAANIRQVTFKKPDTKYANGVTLF